ncbi:MAG: L,D-transpeptidase [Chloroflexi bacterium]|nr:L,D-transpeptidase [Chloroflexota bacterium]MBV9131609.1 L,D-transpeptidase [Chloroflexota bacterium]
MVRRRDFLRLLPTSGLISLSALGGPASAFAATPTPTLTPTPRPVASPTPAPSPSPTPSPTPVAQAWVQALRALPLWSGPDDNAEQFGYAARWDYFLIVHPQVGQRLSVFVARTNNYAWVDALAVGPSGPPPAGWPPADLAAPPEDLSVGWVATVADAALWADADATLFLGLAPAYTPLKQLEDQSGARLHVQDPFSGANAWIAATDVGPIGSPDPIGAPGRWWGISYVDGANLRSGASTRSDALGELPAGLPIVVSDWVAGEEVIPDNPTWAYLGNSTYLYSSVLRPVALPAAPLLPDVGYTGRWIDLNLLHQVVVAYEGSSPVRLARTSTGRPGWETAAGNYSIQRRVANETMDSTSLIGLDAARADYKVENVRWTQYFSADGKALHENYWKARDEFGIPSSHGCAGLVAEDAFFFWNWADIGVPIIAHY